MPTSRRPQGRGRAAFGCLLALLTLALASACDITPVHKKGGELGRKLRAIQVRGLPATRDGQYFRAALEDSLNPEASSPKTRLRLTPTLTIRKQQLSINADGTIRRYQLVGSTEVVLEDPQSGATLWQGKLERFNSYQISQGDYSTFVASRRARQELLDALAEAVRLNVIGALS